MKTFLGFLVVVLMSMDTANAQWAQCGAYAPSGDVRAFTVSGNTLIAATAMGGVFRSTDYGKSWSSSRAALPDVRITSITDHSSGLYLGTSRGIFRSTDHAQSWTAVNPEQNHIAVLTLTTKGSALFAGTVRNGVLRSTDNGASWQQVTAGLTMKLVTTLAVCGDALFAGGKEIYRSMDDGKSWVEVHGEIPSRTFIALAVHGQTLFAATEGAGIYRSFDYGTSWEEVNTGLGDLTVMSLLVRGNTIFAATFDGVYVTMNNGNSWENVHTGIGSNYIGSLTASAHSIYASTTGKGIWKLDLEALGAQENPGSSSTQDMQHINCYPNPATRLLTIDCTSLSFAPGLPVNYTFTTLTGAKVAEFERTEQHFSVSLSGMASGVYYLMAEQGAHTASVMVTIVE